jgi:glycosyltransferase involved in cell wall biosynthesis
MSALHERGDCYVSLCRSEGWGLGAFDAAARGKPVIMTGYGGQTEFLSEDSAYRVDYRLVPVRAGFFQHSYTPDQNWAEPDLDHASRLFRHVFENREEARRRGCALGKHVRNSFDAGAVAKTFLDSIS